ncbi:hypothetical protein [Tautonia plasticadhaerens]|uniref:Bacterial membrane protein YfhO n=1 Tax=Tautonia plasticadhaerens TaxID=2527974 RepID=A0A518HDB2_9BACT|nr:hypothetical protein [Tautonia plasticadhaerens]QDV38851.1 hypothetical protein ElP_68090 [Tautonia plasticadhaerens]
MADQAPTPPDRLRPRFVIGLLAAYTLAALVASYPSTLQGRSALAVADLTDPLQHLWTMRWYRDCLLGGRSPFVSPVLQAPVGSPLGLYSPLLLQSILYLVLAGMGAGDVLAYNLILLIQAVFTGFATFLLAWHLLRRPVPSALAGLLAMLCGPMVFAAQSGGTELLSLGGFPLFLLGWMRLVERPSAGRLAAANGAFLLLALGSPYYAFMSAFPAALFAAVEATRGGGRGGAAWLRPRWRWLIGFSAIVLLSLPLAAPTQLWAAWQGVPMGRSRAHFEQFRAIPWGYVIPPPANRLTALVVPPFWSTPGVVERESIYLGAVTLGLLGLGAVGRVRFRHSGFLWACLGMLVVLSMGPHTTIGSTRIPLPGSWLWDHLPGFRAMRVPARFGFLGAACAAVLAGGTTAALLDRVRSRPRRLALAVGLPLLALADLSSVPFPSRALPDLPPAYARLAVRAPDARICEIHPTGSGFDFLRYESTLAYWQSQHGLTTSAGNPGVENRRFTARILASSPFFYTLLADPGYLADDPGPIPLPPVQGARFEDLTWLWIHAHRYDFIVMHKWTWDGSPPPPALLRARERLAAAIVDEDGQVVVLDPRRLPPPSRPVALCRSGWRERLIRLGAPAAIAEQDAEILAYNPTPGLPLRLELAASSYLEPRLVRLESGGRVLARWEVRPESASTLLSPPISLPEGIHALVLSSDGACRPRRPEYAPVPGDEAPFSLWVTSIRLLPEPKETATATAGPTPTAR